MKKNDKIKVDTINNDERIVDTLRASETIFRSYFEMDLHGIAITSPNKGWIEVNDKLCSMLGYTRQEILKMTWAEMTYPDDLAADEKLFNQVMSGKIDHYNLSKRFIKKDKSIIWTNLSVGCIKKDNGEVDYLIALLEDITEHKKEEELLRSKTALLEAQLNANIDGILVIDKDQKIAVTNQQAIDLLDIPADILASKDNNALLKHITALMKEPKQFLEKVLYLYSHPGETYHDEMQRKNGVILNGYSAPVMDQDNNNYGRLWIFRDITQQKNLEKEILKEQEEQKTILDSIPAGVFYKDKNSLFLRVNESYANIIGLPKEKMIGKALFDLSTKEQAAQIQSDDNEIIRSGKPKYNIIHKIKTPRGLIWLKTDKIPYFNKDKEIIGIIGFSLDITAQKIAEDKIKEHNAEMEKMNQFMIGRELKMVELKQEIAKLKK
ncbi:MAG: PAS domain S-box protein [Patescibacteria group bacterium]